LDSQREQAIGQSSLANNDDSVRGYGRNYYSAGVVIYPNMKMDELWDP